MSLPLAASAAQLMLPTKRGRSPSDADQDTSPATTAPLHAELAATVAKGDVHAAAPAGDSPLVGAKCGAAAASATRELLHDTPSSTGRPPANNITGGTSPSSGASAARTASAGWGSVTPSATAQPTEGPVGPVFFIVDDSPSEEHPSSTKPTAPATNGPAAAPADGSPNYLRPAAVSSVQLRLFSVDQQLGGSSSSRSTSQVPPLPQSISSVTGASDTSPAARKTEPGKPQQSDGLSTGPPPAKAMATEKRIRNRSNPTTSATPVTLDPAAAAAAADATTTTTALGCSPLSDNSAAVSLSSSRGQPSVKATGASVSSTQQQQQAPATKGPLRQSTLSFGISLEGELRKALLEKEKEAQELTLRLAASDDLRFRIESDLRHALRAKDGELAALTASFVKEQHRSQQYQTILFDVLTENARYDRAEARRSMWEKHNELGHVASIPSTVGGMKEVWVEGQFWRESIREAEALSKRKAEVEVLKKAAEKKLRQTAKASSFASSASDQTATTTTTTSNSSAFVAFADDNTASNGFGLADQLLEAEETVELLKQELDSIDRHHTELQRKREQHDIHKAAFLREIRRINDEDASEFFHTETLHNGRYVVISLLGKGGFSEVWKAFDLLAARYVAVKIHKVSKDMSPSARANYLKHAERELEIMRGLDHPRLVKLFDVFELNEHSFASVMELSMGEDLDAYLKAHRLLKEHDARVILIQMVSALRYFADLDNPVIHYDLKPANVLFHSALSTSFDIKITDFGLSKVIMQHGAGATDDPSIELTSQGTGTFWYLPPETFETGSTPRISNKVDIWAVGVIFFQMLYGKRPFAEGENQRRIWHDKLIVHRARTLEFPPLPPGQRVSNEAKELIKKCLAFDVHDRIDVVQLSNDPYLRRKGAVILQPSGTAAASAAAALTFPVPPPQPAPLLSLFQRPAGGSGAVAASSSAALSPKPSVLPAALSGLGTAGLQGGGRLTGLTGVQPNSPLPGMAPPQ